jgi:positive regulator of sigma E activity
MTRELAIVVLYMLAGLASVSPGMSIMLCLVMTAFGLLAVSLHAKDVRNGARAR